MIKTTIIMAIIKLIIQLRKKQHRWLANRFFPKEKTSPRDLAICTIVVFF
jgi:hypothetical protein